MVKKSKSKTPPKRKRVADEEVEPKVKHLPLLDCSQTCVQKALASQIVLEALASTVWEPVEYKHMAVEYLVTDICIVQLTKGRQTFGVTIQALDNPRDEKDDILLHEFLTTFHPVRQLNVKEYQS